MSYEPERAMKWRHRAAQLRVRAESAAGPTDKQDFLRLAEYWDRKADEAERQARIENRRKQRSS